MLTDTLAPQGLVAHEHWLAALPIAAAVVELGSVPSVVACNEAFRRCERLAAAESGQGLLVGALLLAIHDAVADGERRRCPLQVGAPVEGLSFAATVTPLRGTDQAIVTLVETTAVAQATRLLRRQMVDDALTGLPNRAGFVEALDRSLQEGQAGGVLAIDLARFSQVNDCMGPLGGDELLVTVARRLKSGLRGDDVLARTGANEFAISVATSGGADLLGVAQRVQAALAEPFRLSDFEIKVDCAIGCAVIEGADAEQGMRHAQLALKTAKQSRRVELYKPDALVVARRRFLLETDLRRAIEHDELELAYQPLVALATQRLTGFEALARWHHPTLGPISPGEFVPIAEEAGLIVPLGRWVINRAVEALGSWRLPQAVSVAVNLSPLQIANDDLATFIAHTLHRHDVDGERLTVELTETVLVTEPQRAATVLSELKAQRLQVAMDDFGTGYSNLASLRRFPIDILKIDRSLISGMTENSDDVAIVRAIQSMAQTLGLKVTAEGVESRELVTMLAAMGCTTAQGYCFSPPLAPAAAVEFAAAFA